MVGKLDSRPLGAVRGTARLYRAMARAVLENRREDVDKLGVSLASSEIMGWKEGRKEKRGGKGRSYSIGGNGPCEKMARLQREWAREVIVPR